MQDHHFQIQDEGRSVWIDGQCYQPIAHAELPGSMRCAQTGEMVLVHRYRNLTGPEVEAKTMQILGRYFRDTCDISQIRTDRDRYMEDARRELRSARDGVRYLVPEGITVVGQADGMYSVYTYSRLPAQFAEQTHVLSRVVAAQKAVPVKVRMRAARWLAAGLEHLYARFGGQIYSLLPEDVLVDIKTGAVCLVLGRCFVASDVSLAPDPQALYYIRCWGTEPLPEHELVRSAAYSCFRLLLGGDPYDGRYTLVNYPLLTERVLWRLHRGILRPEDDSGAADRFICGSAVNGESRMIGHGIRDRYERLPAFIKERFQQTLGVPEPSITLQTWTREMCMLYDCLLCDSEKDQYVFWDPEQARPLLYLKNDSGYQIPLWRGKEICWYHIGCSYQDSVNGVQKGRVGAVHMQGTTPCLQNKTNRSWDVVDANGKRRSLPPGGEIPLSPQMRIAIGDVSFEVAHSVPEGRAGSQQIVDKPLAYSDLRARLFEDVSKSEEGETS